jgi:hypothetical protein
MNAPKHGNNLYPETSAKLAHSRAMMRFYNAAEKLLNHGHTCKNHTDHGERLYVIKKHFNRGGIAVWGETYAKIYRTEPTPASALQSMPTLSPITYTPIVEAFDTEFSFGGFDNGRILIRQWDGHNSGHNNYVQTLEQFVTMVRELESKPFVRF